MRTANMILNATVTLTLAFVATSAFASDTQNSDVLQSDVNFDKPAIIEPTDRPDALPTHTSASTDLGPTGTVPSMDDVVTVLMNWGACSLPADALCAGDYNGDHVINEQDLLYLIRLINQANSAH